MVNVDASFDDDVGCGSTKVIIRDHSGGLIAAVHSFVPYVGSRLVIQADCTEVVETMKEGGFMANLAAAIYDECIVIWSGFQEISIEHCSRDANRVAHELARRAMQTKTGCIWDEEPLVSFMSLYRTM